MRVSVYSDASGIVDAVTEELELILAQQSDPNTALHSARHTRSSPHNLQHAHIQPLRQLIKHLLVHWRRLTATSSRILFVVAILQPDD